MITLNIIPSSLKDTLRSSARLSRWLTVVLMLLIIVVLGTGAATVAWSMLDRHAIDVHQQLVEKQQRLSTDTKGDISGTTNTLNSTIKQLSTALGEPQSWSHGVAAVLTGLPAGITISQLSLLPKGQFHLQGIATTRETFVALDTALKSNPQLEKVTTSSAPSKRTAVPFDYSGTVTSQNVKP